MKIYSPCPVCSRANEATPISELPVYPATILESGLMVMKCEFGHESRFILPNQKYALLFESGAFALADGYAREAVASFAVAIERYYESIIRLLISGRFGDTKHLETVWKGVAKQSERQLGAFRFLYLFTFKTPPPDMEKYTGFRNSVIHKGIFPSEDETLDYGQACIDHVAMIESVLSDDHDRLRRLLIEGVCLDRICKEGKGLEFGNVSFETTILERLMSRSGRVTPLREWIEFVRTKPVHRLIAWS